MDLADLAVASFSCDFGRSKFSQCLSGIGFWPEYWWTRYVFQSNVVGSVECTGCLYKLLPINLLFGPLKCSKSNLNPVHVFLHFNSFCLEVLKLILASKLSKLELFENWAANGLFLNKIEFSGKWLHLRAKCKKGDPV